MSKAALKFVFFLVNDVEAVARFYREGLGLGVRGGEAEGWASVDAGSELVFVKGDYPLPVASEWSWQPGYQGGLAHTTSFGLSYDDEASYRAALAGLERVGAPLLAPKPAWRRDCYWGITARDPMGVTWELYWTPEQKPDALAWR